MTFRKQHAYIAAALIAVLTSIGIGAYSLMAPLSAKQSTHYIYIDTDDTADSIMSRIDTISNRASAWMLRSMMQYDKYDQHIKTGRYAIKQEENALDVLRKLKRGHQEPINLAIPEFRSMHKMAGYLGRKLMADSTEFAQTFADSALCAEYGVNQQTIYALFVPNTYSVYWDTDATSLLQRIAREHKTFWQKNGRQAKADEMGMTIAEVATLASIIDEETRANSEKPMVAGMYLNRLRKGIPLQADPTIKFAMQQFGLRRIYNSMLKTESPYNTYIHKGLPPGPIKIASIASIDAVLNHAQHDYLYMCAKEDFSGTHNFARTYSEHLRNAARYRKALNQRNIK